ncbi:MAG: hypothetical protein ACMG6E_01635 [Candidatus Roizmanbacteria bacterium]
MNHKNLIILATTLAIISYSLSGSNVHAIGITPTLIPSLPISPAVPPSKLDEKVQVLKEKLENKVAEISKTNKKILSGVIDKIAEGSVTVKSRDEKIYTVTIDKDFSDIKSVSTKGLLTKLKYAELASGDYVVIEGFQLETDVNANKIYRQTPLKMIEGQITNVNETNSLDIVTSDKIEMTIDIETTTSQQMVNAKTLKIEKAGFSKYKVGDHVTAAIKSTDTKKVSATRILLIPQEYFVK